MGHALMWIETLVAAVLFVATAAACAARWEKRWKQVLVVRLATLLPLGIGIVQVGYTAILKFKYHLEHSWFGYTTSWTICLAIGAAVVLFTGLRRGADGTVAPPARGWPRGRLAIGWGVAMALYFATFWNMDVAARMQLLSMRAEAAASALAAAPPRVPDHENAALIYDEAFEALAAEEASPGETKQKAKRWLDLACEDDLNPKDPELDAYLARRSGVITLLRRAAAMPGCYFEHDYGWPDLEMAIPELTMFRESARLLALDARLKASRGEVRGALEDVAAMLNMAGHASQEPYLISCLVALALERTGSQTLEKILGSGTPTREALEALKEVRRMSYRLALKRALHEERAFGMAAYTVLAGDVMQLLAPAGGHGESLGALAPLALLGTPLWRVFLLPSDHAGYNRLMRDWFNYLSEPFHSRQEEWRLLEKKFVDTRPGVLAGMLVPTVVRCVQQAALGDARRRLLRLGVGALEYRTTEGQYPQRLEDLVPKYIPRIPIDPFSGHPLRMVAKGSGVILYSVGPDLTDDEGRELDTSKEPTSGDITLRLGT